LFSQWSAAKFFGPESANTIPIGLAMMRFIFNGGKDWMSGFQFHYSFLLFLFMLGYNLLRGIFLWKTKQLELEEQSSGLPAKFQFGISRFGWEWWFRFGRIYGRLYLLIGLFNLLHFMGMEIPVDIQASQYE
jgi:hypothetical protein